jgi:hypothetical protein
MRKHLSREHSGEVFLCRGVVLSFQVYRTKQSMNAKLHCAVYGEGTVFPVNIAMDADVSALQEAIFYKKRYNDQYKFDPSALTLYLARKNDVWLKGDESLDTILQQAVDPQYKRMLPLWQLDDYFDKDFMADKREIHVLVKLPDAAGGSEESTMAQLIKEMHAHIVQTKRKRYSYSSVGSSKARELLQALNIDVEPVRTVPVAVGDHTSVDPFQWESVRDVSGQDIVLFEEQQRDRYRAYVEENIGRVLTEKKLCVVGVEKGQNILTVRVPGHDLELAGRTDLLILSDLVKEDPSNLQFLPGVKMLIEVKREVKPDAVFQALLELIGLDLLAKDTVMALLTDLNHNWQFFWVSERSGTRISIRKATITEPGVAFQVIRTLLAQSSGDTDIPLACFPEPVKRRKLAQLMPMVSEEGASSDVRGAIERYFDIASVLGPDIAMAREAASQIVRSIPAFSYYT